MKEDSNNQLDGIKNYMDSNFIGLDLNDQKSICMDIVCTFLIEQCSEELVEYLQVFPSS